MKFITYKLTIICFNPCFIGTYSFTPILIYLMDAGTVVLILVLLELILLHLHPFELVDYYYVLILVLLELILLLYFILQLLVMYLRFNPCFIGTYSFTIYDVNGFARTTKCFNPCFIGTYSFTNFWTYISSYPYVVLILVLLELILLLFVLSIAYLSASMF